MGRKARVGDLTFPVNFICFAYDIQEKEEKQKIYDAYFGKGDVKGTFWYYMYQGCSEDELDVVTYRYRYHKTLLETGNEMGRSKERIRQMETRAVRIIRCVPLQKLLTGIQETTRNICLEEKKKTLAVTGEAFEAGRKKAVEDLKKLTPETYATEETETVMSLEDFVHISHLPKHIHNALTRGGVSSVLDLMRMTEVQFFRIRGLGKTALQKVNDALQSMELPPIR